MGSGGICEGAAPPREQVVRLSSCSPKWGLCPHSPPRAGAPREHGLAMLGAPAYYFTMRGAAPLCTPQSRRSALHPGDFPDAGKVTKGAPRAAALWNPASEDNPPLLVLRCACTRAAFSHNKRPICHFKFVGKSVFFLPKLHRGSHPLLSIRGAVGEVPSRMLEGLSYREQYR